MAKSPTIAERAMMVAGICTTCGAQAQSRNGAGQCIPCHNRAYAAWKIEYAEWLAHTKEEGRRWWAARGILPGDKVRRFADSMIGFGGIEVLGIAKVGRVGAYVSAPHFQSGYLTRHGWTKVEV